MHFVSMGDAKYFQTILFSVKQSARYYEDRRFLFYDWGLHQDQLEELSNRPNVEVVNWRDRVVDVNRIFPAQPALKLFIKKHILRHPHIRKPLIDWQREFLLDEKCYCLLDAAFRIDEAFLFLDADAFVVNRVDDLFNSDSDVIVTLRPFEEIEAARKRGARHEINSGVIFFGRAKQKRTTFIIEWIKEMHLLNLQRQSLSEQTALSNMILKGDMKAFEQYNNEVKLMISDMPINCKVLSTFNYNYSSIENGFDPNINRIIHLKSRRDTTKTLEMVFSRLEV